MSASPDSRPASYVPNSRPASYAPVAAVSVPGGILSDKIPPLKAALAAKIETRTDVAVNILWNLDPAGRHDLAAIDPLLPVGHPAKIEAATFAPSQRDAATAWIEARQGRKNLYTSVNRAAANAAVNARLRKKDIGTLLAISLDIDPKKIKGGDPTGENFKIERARLLKLVTSLAGVECPPTLIVDSGGGYQAWWQLAEPLPATSENVALVEGIGRPFRTDTVAIPSGTLVASCGCRARLMCRARKRRPRGGRQRSPACFR